MRLTRIAGEFVVIVAGVITALAADAWNQRRLERNTANEYLEQLRLDTRQNQALLDSAIAATELSVESVNEIRTTLNSGSQVSVGRMTELVTQRRLLQQPSVRLVRGTLLGLVGGADMILVRDVSLRTAILDHASQMEGYLDDLVPFQEDLDFHGDELVSRWQAESTFDPDPEDFSAWLARDDTEATRMNLAKLWLAGENQRTILRNMAAATASLAAVLDQAR